MSRRIEPCPHCGRLIQEPLSARGPQRLFECEHCDQTIVSNPRFDLFSFVFGLVVNAFGGMLLGVVCLIPAVLYETPWWLFLFAPAAIKIIWLVSDPLRTVYRLWRGRFVASLPNGEVDYFQSPERTIRRSARDLEQRGALTSVDDSAPESGALEMTDTHDVRGAITESS